MNNLARFISRLSLGVMHGAIHSGCKEDPDLESYCANKTGLTASCAGQSVECEKSPCYEDCTTLGHDAAEFSDTCGALWIEIYECLAEMSCDGVDAWRSAQIEDTIDYPCGTLEAEFRKTCPDIPLYGPNS